MTRHARPPSHRTSSKGRGGCSRRRHLNRSPWNRINGCTIFSFLSLSPSSQFFYFWPLFVFVLFLILTTLRRDDVTILSPSLKCRNLNFQKAASLRMMIFPRHDAIPCFDFVLNLPIFSLSVGLEPSRGSFSPSSHIFHTWGWSPRTFNGCSKIIFLHRPRLHFCCRHHLLHLKDTLKNFSSPVANLINILRA